MSTGEPVSGWKDELQVAARRLGAAVWAGVLSGALIGGVGGRLAMFVLRLTSDPSLRGRETDDGFIIGSFTSDTGFLVLVATAIGMLAGVAYLVLRNLMPEGRRILIASVIGGVFGGAVIIRPDGIDFTELEPLSLAVVLFILLPALQGAATAYLTERFLDRVQSSDRKNWIVVIVALVPLAVGGIFGLALLVLALAVWFVARRFDLKAVVERTNLIPIGRRTLAIAVVWFLYTLMMDLAMIA